MTAFVYASEWGVSVQHAQRMLEAAAAKGLAEKKTLTCRTEAGTRKFRHYKLTV